MVRPVGQCTVVGLVAILELSCRGFRVEWLLWGWGLSATEYRNNLALSTMVVDRPKPQRTEFPAPGSPREIGTSDLQKCSIGSWMEPRQVTLRGCRARSSVSFRSVRSTAGDESLHTETRDGFSRPPKNWATGEMLWHVLTQINNGVVVTVSCRAKFFGDRGKFVRLRSGVGKTFGWGMCSYCKLNLLLATLPPGCRGDFNMPQGTPDQTISVPDGIPTIRVVSATDLVGSKEADDGGSVASVIWDYHAALGAVLTRSGFELPKAPACAPARKTIGTQLT